MKLFPITSVHASSQRSLKSKMTHICLSAAFPLLLLGGGSAGAAELIESGLQNSSDSVVASSIALAAGDLYVAPGGSASNPGTLTSPTSLANALTQIAPGKTIYLRGGTYSFSETVTIERGNSGTSGQRKNLVAYGSEKPVLDFSAQAFASTNRGLQMFGDYWLVKGLEVKGAGDNGIFIGGSYNRLEQIEAHHNRDTGIQLGRYASTAANSEWPAYNEIIRSYSHDNYDPDDGEDADGFAAKLTVGPGNLFDGCIAAYNVDDGWDLYSKTDTGAIGVVTIRNSISHHNGQTSDVHPPPIVTVTASSWEVRKSR